LSPKSAFFFRLTYIRKAAILPAYNPLSTKSVITGIIFSKILNWSEKMKVEIPFDEIVPSLKTGDIFLVSGRVPTSIAIEIFEGSPWTHSCMVVRSKDIGLKSPIPSLLVWESNDLTNLSDVIFKDKKTGPMLVDLKKRLETDMSQHVDASFALRYLYTERTQDMFNALHKLMISIHSATFPTFLEMGVEAFRGRFLHKDVKRDNYFCSELIAQSFMNMGLMSTVNSANAYLPKDFSESNKLPMINRAYFGEEIKISIE
jgi:hypothetical protein